MEISPTKNSLEILTNFFVMNEKGKFEFSKQKQVDFLSQMIRDNLKNKIYDKLV